MTYSIIARDSETGALGVAVLSRWFSVGQFVPWVEGGVGATASQSFAEPSYGPRALDAIRAGTAPEQALAALVAADPGSDTAQVAVVDADGRVAVHTGMACIGERGHALAEGVSCQGNMLAREGVPEAMLAAYERAEGELADRLLAALDGAAASGGDLRGGQSAALVVVRAERASPTHEGRLELRVDDHPSPLAELHRLLAVQRIYAELALAQLAGLDGDAEGAWMIVERALAAAPGNDHVQAFGSLAARASGRTEEADRLLAAACEVNSAWAVWTERFRAAGHLT